MNLQANPMAGQEQEAGEGTEENLATIDANRRTRRAEEAVRKGSKRSRAGTRPDLASWGSSSSSSQSRGSPTSE